MTKISTIEKYSQPEVVSCWQNLSRQGLQKAEAEMATRYLPPGARLLDVGCGAGRAVLALSQAGHRVTGIDVSRPLLAAARRLSGQAHLAAADLLALPFAAEEFEATLMFFGAVQHIPGRDNRRRAMAEMARVTQRRGRLLVGLDNLAPALICYCYWFIEKLRGVKPAGVQATATPADATLWSRETRRVHPLLWHARGLARSLRWRTWPGLVDGVRRLDPRPGPAEPGDTWVAQFSLQATPGRIYYHVYGAEELVEDAAGAGWRLLAHHSGRELSEDRVYPPLIRRQDKQQFFAFECGA
ncbi:MAG: class I SAM-dependent methyltransferase [Chloroflexota bacterium]